MYILTEVEDVIPEPIQFEWDKGNIDKSFKKHGITNEEAEEVFVCSLTVLLEDEKHSGIEKRYLLLGKSEEGKLLSVIFTIRGRKVRVVSARPVSRKERRLYENQ